MLTQSEAPVTSASGGAHGAGATFFLQAKRTAITWHNSADSVMGGIFALIFGVTLAGRILNSQTCHCPELLRVILVA